jgi:hypothetical protein
MYASCHRPWNVCVVAWGHGVYASCYRSHAHRSHTNLSSARAACETFQKPIGLTPSHSIGVILWPIGLTSALTSAQTPSVSLQPKQARAGGSTAPVVSNTATVQVEYRNCSGYFYLVSQVETSLKLLEFRDLHLDHLDYLDHLDHLTISRAGSGARQGGRSPCLHPWAGAPTPGWWGAVGGPGPLA